MASRTTFIVDGFNLYHSLDEAARFEAVRKQVPVRLANGTKWLDLHRLLREYLPLLGKDATLGEIYYFSALAVHMEKRRPGTVARHEAYLRVLRDSGVSVELSRFKKKDVTCGATCRLPFVGNEEKETDVAIAAKLFEVLHLNQCEHVILVTGDTDQIPAVKTAKRLFPSCAITFAFPWDRETKELKAAAPGSFSISIAAYLKHQFTDTVKLKDGVIISKPATW